MLGQIKFSVVVLGYVYSLKKKKKKRGDVTILCDAPYVRDVSALFGHGNKANRFHSTHGLPHVETGPVLAKLEDSKLLFGAAKLMKELS